MNGRRPLTENNQQQANHSSLIRISCVNKTTARSINEFAVPKCLFTNICGLSKVKNRVRAEVALEADFRNHDIDVAVVSETHLAANIPDSIANIQNYILFRRDRGWYDLDRGKNGGVAIYVRKNLKVLDIYRARLYELICLTLLLPSGHHLLICGIYNLPKHTYKEAYLMNYLIVLLIAC